MQDFFLPGGGVLPRVSPFSIFQELGGGCGHICGVTWAGQGAVGDTSG